MKWIRRLFCKHLFVDPSPESVVDGVTVTDTPCHFGCGAKRRFYYMGPYGEGSLWSDDPRAKAIAKVKS